MPKSDGNEWEAAESEVAIHFTKLGSGRQYVIEDNAEGTKHETGYSSGRDTKPAHGLSDWV